MVTMVTMGVGIIFPEGPLRGFLQNLSWGGQKWSNLTFPTRN